MGNNGTCSQPQAIPRRLALLVAIALAVVFAVYSGWKQTSAAQQKAIAQARLLARQMGMRGRAA